MAFVSAAASYAQEDTSHLRVSLVTCSPGDAEVWEVFGHTAIRVIDSIAGTDDVYNYGTFEYGPDFEMKFMRGKLMYSLSVYPFNAFYQEYVEAGRGVQEQELLLPMKQKKQLIYFLNYNALPENKEYKYDHFFDNCATRIRDIFPRAEIYGPTFRYGQVLPKDSRITFRDIVNVYFYRDHWTRLGVNILFGMKTDSIMTNRDIMFLPDYLRDGVKGATANGLPVATPPQTLLAPGPVAPKEPNLPLMLTCLLAVLTIAGVCIPKLQALGRIMSTLLLVVTGILGIVILLMWLGTEHQCCDDNLNVLWCLPTNILVAIFKLKGKGRYAIIAIGCIFISVLLHITAVQGLTLEMYPLMLALLFIFGTIYRKERRKISANAPKN